MNKKALFWSFIIILTSSYIVNTRLNTDFIGSSSLDVPCQFGTYIESSGETYYCHSDHLLYKTHRIGYDGHDAENKTICLGCLRWSGTSDGVHEIYSVETVDINGTVYAEIGVSLPEQERGKNLSYGSRLRNPDEFTTYSEVSRSIVVDTTTPLLYVPLPHDIESVFLVVGPNSTTIKLQNDSGIPHDTYVDGYNPSYENGQKSTFSVRLNISSPTRENWPVLAFNMSQVPTGQVPTEALLELYLISEDLDFNEYNSITAYPLPCDGSWNVTGNSPIEGDSSGVPADNATGEISKNTMAVGSQFLNQSGCGHIQIDNGGAGLYYNLTLTQCISDAWNAGCTDLAWVYLIDFNGSAGGADEGNYGASEWTTSSQRVALWLTYATPTLSCGIYDSCVQLTSDNNTDDAFARDAAKTTEYDCDDTIATYNHMYMHRPFSTADARGFTRWDISNIPDTGSLYNASLRWKVDSNQLESGECFPIWIYLINDSGWQPDGSVVTEGGSCGNAAEAGDFEWQDAYFNGSTGEITETEGYYLLNHTRCGEYNISYAEANAGDWINFDVSECLRQSIAAGLDNMTLGMYTPTGTVDGANWCGATSGDAIYFASSEDSDTTIRPVLNTYWNEPLISYLSVDFGEPYTDELSPTTKSLWKFTPSASHAVTNCTLWENITGGGFVERNSTTSVTNGSENIIYFNDTDGAGERTWYVWCTDGTVTNSTVNVTWSQVAGTCNLRDVYNITYTSNCTVTNEDVTVRQNFNVSSGVTVTYVGVNLTANTSEANSHYNWTVDGTFNKTLGWWKGIEGSDPFFRCAHGSSCYIKNQSLIQDICHSFNGTHFSFATGDFRASVAGCVMHSATAEWEYNYLSRIPNGVVWYNYTTNGLFHGNNCTNVGGICVTLRGDVTGETGPSGCNWTTNVGVNISGNFGDGSTYMDLDPQAQVFFAWIYDSDNWTFEDNNCNNFERSCLYVDESGYGTVARNNFTNGTWSTSSHGALQIDGCASRFVTFSDIRIVNATDIGIHTNRENGPPTNLTFSRIYIDNPGDYGTFFKTMENSTLDRWIINNSGGYGLYFTNDSTGPTNNGNTVTNMRSCNSVPSDYQMEPVSWIVSATNNTGDTFFNFKDSNMFLDNMSTWRCDGRSRVPYLTGVTVASVDSAQNGSATTVVINDDNNNSDVRVNWYVNGTYVFSCSFDAQANNTQVECLLSPSNFSEGDDINATAYAEDVEGNSTLQFSDNATVSASDTCTPTGGADWSVTLDDLCVYNGPSIVVGNMTLSGQGTFRLNGTNLETESMRINSTNYTISINEAILH